MGKQYFTSLAFLDRLFRCTAQGSGVWHSGYYYYYTMAFVGIMAFIISFFFLFLYFTTYRIQDKLNQFYYLGFVCLRET
jgi:uncharacterized membrane protein YdbT with pleckstrin-like domain